MIHHFLFRPKYPKFILFFFTVFLAYFLYEESAYGPLHDFVFSLGYFGSFIAGLMFTFGFTTAFAIALFLVLAKSQNIFLAAFIGGIGSLISDFIIFKFIRKTFSDEISKLTHEKVISYLDRHIPHKIKKYFVAFLGGVIIASPLPDEIGVALLASSVKISTKMFGVVSYLSNTIGIFIVLLIGNAI